MDEEPVRRAFRRVWIVVLAAAVVDATRNHRLQGEVFGFVPYDFRPPNLDRARRHAWDPDSSRVLAPTTFGVGWSLNLGRLARLAGIV
ncbi:MAG TPA: hypothetical protein VE736_00140 [Gaiellaceae bacterium]|nr:hypothetical protein [Gaiellaceae bacterium]